MTKKQLPKLHKLDSNELMELYDGLIRCFHYCPTSCEYCNYEYGSISTLRSYIIDNLGEENFEDEE